MEIERHEIRMFRAVAEAGGFSRAADRLDVSQSAVSQAIANLEHKLGTPLFSRAPPIRLTEAGIRFLRFAEAFAKEESEVLADIDEIKVGARSVLSLALSSAVNRRYGVELLRAFCERNPLTRLKVDVAPSREIVLGVGAGRWEIGFGPLPHQLPRHYGVMACFNETRRLVVAENHPVLQLRGEAVLKALKEMPLITSYLEEPARRSGGVRLRDAFASIWEVSHMELRLALVADGKGATYVSDLILDDEDVLEGVRHVRAVGGIEFANIERRVGLYYLKDQPQSQAGKRFRALCRERFAASDDS